MGLFIYSKNQHLLYIKLDTGNTEEKIEFPVSSSCFLGGGREEPLNLLQDEIP